MCIKFLEWRTYKIDDCMALGVIVDIAVVVIVVGGGGMGCHWGSSEVVEGGWRSRCRAIGCEASSSVRDA